MRKVALWNSVKMPNINKSYPGIPLEWELAEIVATKQPIKATSPIIFTAREEGVRAETDIRTDRWDIAMDAMNAISKSKIAKRLNSETTVTTTDGPVTE